MNARIYSYVGPPEIQRRFEATQGEGGTPVMSAADLRRWFAEHNDDAISECVWATYVVDESGTLRLAPRRSEHVACAGGKSVRAAGELSIDDRGAVRDLTNNSTGYCPDVVCLEAVVAALDAIGASHPRAFTFEAIFRRCAACGERNLVKDDWFVCALCDAELPPMWNFGE